MNIFIYLFIFSSCIYKKKTPLAAPPRNLALLEIHKFISRILPDMRFCSCTYTHRSTNHGFSHLIHTLYNEPEFEFEFGAVVWYAGNAKFIPHRNLTELASLAGITTLLHACQTQADDSTSQWFHAIAGLPHGTGRGSTKCVWDSCHLLIRYSLPYYTIP